MDSFLLQQFPGRFLEEIDEIDYVRLMRALTVRSIGETEQLKLSYVRGLLKSSQISSKQWERIAEHDNLMDE